MTEVQKCVYKKKREREREKETRRERGNPYGFSVFFAGQKYIISSALPRAKDLLKRREPIQQLLLHQLLRDRWRVMALIQRYPLLPGDPVARVARKNGVTCARSWHYIPLYVKSRGISAIRYGRYL